MTTHLLAAFWSDDSGSIIATEYLMLGTVVALGSATGLASLRDSMNDEYREFGQSVQSMRQQYAAAPASGSAAAHGGTYAVDTTPAAVPAQVVNVTP